MNFRTIILSGFLLLVVASSGLGEEESNRRKIVENPYVCQPGTRFKVDCNTCRCGNVPGMLGACTRINCLIKEGECIPNTLFLFDDKLCHCPESGIQMESDCFVKSN